jgi:co-chaperonin GroES (HSP10)
MTRRVAEFPIVPRLDYIYVVDYGQPDKTEGGIYVPDSSTDHWRYRHDLWRFGEVVAMGPGRFLHERTRERRVMPPIELGDVVMFSRKHGTRLGSGWRFKIPKFSEPLLIRVLDPDKCVAIVHGFVPWWNVEDCQLYPEGVLTG